jgi:hypothetical protein
MEEQIRQGVTLKAVPKDVGGKKTVKVTPMSNNAQLQYQTAMRMQNNEKIRENSSENEYD